MSIVKRGETLLSNYIGFDGNSCILFCKPFQMTSNITPCWSKVAMFLGFCVNGFNRLIRF